MIIISIILLVTITGTNNNAVKLLIWMTFTYILVGFELDFTLVGFPHCNILDNK